MKMGQRRASEVDKRRDRDLLLRMEPELQLLHGSVKILRALGETADSVEPVALATLAHCCGSALEAIDELWRAYLGAR